MAVDGAVAAGMVAPLGGGTGVESIMVAFYRRIEAIEELAGRIKVKMGQDHELPGLSFQGFPELTIVVR